MFFLDHIWLIPLLPAFGAAIMFFFGRKLSKQAVDAVCVGVVVLAFLFGCGAVSQYTRWSHDYPGRPFEKILYTWLGSDTGHLNFLKHDGTPAQFQADAGFLLDPLSSIWLLFVTGVGMLIHIYSTGYMAHEGGYYRFFGYLNLFMFAMLSLILGNNYALMFVGWEGVGLCSYVLIGFYFHRKSATDAANKAFIVNRIGDAGFLLGMFTIAWYFGSLRLTEVTELARSGKFSIGDPVITVATLLLFVGAIGKSAQLPLYVWLPDAMAGRTPVSALIHAATMVTAGVYMVARLSFLYVQAPGVMAVVAVIGVLTAFVGAIIGTAQMDIKRVLAYSTVSQLGYMFVGVGVGAFAAGTAHLITHSFFKACLFLGSGAVIHGLHGEQDMARMGGLRQLGLKHTAATFFIATLAITGILPISGFFSKDEILAQALNTRAFDFLTLLPDPASPRLSWLGPAIYLLGTVTALITSFYMWRCYLLTFEGEYRGPPEVHPHESPWVMTLPLWVLAGLSSLGLLVVLPSQHLPFTWEHFTEGVFARTRGGAPAERLPELVALGIALVVAW